MQDPKMPRIHVKYRTAFAAQLHAARRMKHAHAIHAMHATAAAHTPCTEVFKHAVRAVDGVSACLNVLEVGVDDQERRWRLLL